MASNQHAMIYDVAEATLNTLGGTFMHKTVYIMSLTSMNVEFVENRD